MKGVDRIRLKRLERILKRVNALAEQMAALSDEALQGMTAKLKERYQNGSSLEALLPEAYATVREAARRVLGMYPFDVQVLGAIALHQGRIAEMKTGEGKTLTACMPLYLNALTGKSCMLVTTNGYLANRDGEQMGRLYRWMGLSLAVGVSEWEDKSFQADDKKEIYAADIVYTTHSALGFDYLIDNLQSAQEKRFLRDFYYIIIDEADAVLLDSAHMPLVISGTPRVQSNLYETADYFVTTLKEGRDYIFEEKHVWLTKEGITRAQLFFDVDNLFDRESCEIMRHVTLALRAHMLFERDKQYVVADGELKLLDGANGRILDGVKLHGGQHQALEAMEHLKLTQETRAMASITYQDFFQLFPKKAGLTGTGKHDESEFREIYGLDVVEIPTNRPMIRVDYPDRVYPSLETQMYAALKELMELHNRKQPVLLITDSVAMSEIVSQLLLEQAIPHNVLNAYNAAKEAGIIAEAGQRGAVTVATSMAGRGTDIRLGEGVVELGGLAVIGIGRMENKRMELQARGRSGRQGDPGFSRFYVSLDDDVVAEHGPRWLERFRDMEEQIYSPSILHAVNRAQRVNEDSGRAARKATMDFADSMRSQRELIYKTRDHILNNVQMDEKYLLGIEAEVIEEFIRTHDGKPSVYEITRFVLDQISYRIDSFPKKRELHNVRAVQEYLMGRAKEALDRKKEILGEGKAAQQYYRTMILHAVDEAWIEQVDYLQQLRIVVAGRQYAQRNIRNEYHREAQRSFMRMEKQIKREMMRNILLGDVFRNERDVLQVMTP